MEIGPEVRCLCMSFFGRFAGYFEITAKHLRHSSKRTFLTLVGLTIGIAALVSLVSLGLGLQETINAQFRALGSDKFIVTPGGGFFSQSGASSAVSLTDADITAIKHSRGVKAVSPVIAKTGIVTAGSFSVGTFIIGVDTTKDSRAIFLDSSAYKIDAGRIFNINERGKAVVAWGVLNGKYNFDGHPVEIGKTIYVAGQPFRVIGSFVKQGNPIDDSSIYISSEDAKAIFNTSSYYEVLAQAEDGYDVSLAADNAAKKLRTERNVKKGEEDFTITTPGQLLETFNSVLGAVVAVVAGIALISLLVGGVGIMNTMYTAVLERTTEVGIMKAVGATNGDILGIFILESGMLGLVGGVIGVLIGMGIAKLAEGVVSASGIPNYYAYFPIELIGGSLLFAFVVGTLSGVLPARRASRLLPVDAIRGE